mmetsp:Transcript_95579/g.208999  ORF Transcript_95579/g.208999 Transcript_95579/m.208999 type:complete len:232 (-) Transcript_95579:12-707(-)
MKVVTLLFEDSPRSACWLPTPAPRQEPPPGIRVGFRAQHRNLFDSSVCSGCCIQRQCPTQSALALFRLRVHHRLFNHSSSGSSLNKLSRDLSVNEWPIGGVGRPSIFVSRKRVRFTAKPPQEPREDQDPRHKEEPKPEQRSGLLLSAPRWWVCLGIASLESRQLSPRSSQMMVMIMMLQILKWRKLLLRLFRFLRLQCLAEFLQGVCCRNRHDVGAGDRSSYYVLVCKGRK